MTLTNNIPETMIPGSYSEYNYFAGPNGLPANIQKVLLVGDIAEGGTLAEAKPTAVYNESEVLALVGAGSVLHQMYRAAKNAWKYAQITLLRHKATAGTPATWTITLSNPTDENAATVGGLVRIAYNGKKVNVGVKIGDTAEEVANSIATALNAETAAPFTAEATSGVVTLTAKANGAYISAAKGGVNVSVEVVSTDITAADLILTAGTGEIDVESALAAAFPERFHLIVLPTADEGNLTLLKTHLMQAAFRAQNPCLFLDKDGKTYRKDNAYVFDFDPPRTLTIVETIANDQYKDTAGGAGDSEKRKKHVLELLNFFPVVGEDDNGEMIELDAEKVLTIPRHIHAKEVVNHGFMSNFLFQNISGIFAAPSIVNEILKKVNPVTKAEADKNIVTPEQANELPLDGNGNVDVPSEQVVGTAADKFGDPVFARQSNDFEKDVNRLLRDHKPTEIENVVKELTTVYDVSVKKVAEEAKVKFGQEMTKSQSKEFERKLHDYGQKKISSAAADFKIEAGTAEHKRDEALKNCNSKAEEKQIQQEFKKEMDAAEKKFKETVSDTSDIWKKATEETVKAVEESKIEKKKNDIEEKVRDHLRGFARTIPSFLMAYGNDNTTLETFERDIPGNVFLEVTSITVDEFKFLRDGGDYTDSDGKRKHYNGHLFDSVVFNDSVKEFMRKRRELADYFKDDIKGDIFDYIPPQKTNQIFTPKKVVKDMVDMLEKESPGCFDDPNHTFADLYMKSGLYITEIIKRLYRSKKMKKIFPDDAKRLEHIVKNQVCGAAPTEIIYMIAMHYILGFNNEIEGKTASQIQALYPNFKMKDTAELAKNGKLAEWVKKTYK